MLFIFDWDGTLCNSTMTITRAMQLAAKEIGWQVLEDHEVHEIIGLGLPEALRALYPEADDKGLELLRQTYAKHFIELDQAVPAVLFPGVRDTLDHLKNEGHHLAVATGKARKGLTRMLQMMDMVDYFDATRCADETASKPNPLMLNELLGHFARKVDEAVMLGDTEFDMGMAKVIDMPRIAVSYGAHHIDRLKKYEPELCMDHFPELLGWRGVSGL